MSRLIGFLAAVLMLLVLTSAATPPVAADDGAAPPDAAQLDARIGELASQAQTQFSARQYAEAAESYAALVAVLREKFPADRYPQGHRSLALTLSAVATCHANCNQYAAARREYEAALEMARALYPEDKYPNGHADIAGLLTRLAKVLHAHGEYTEAGRRGQQALDMCRKLYPPETYPDGHPELARALHMMGFYTGGGERGLKLYQEALAMQRKLYPVEKYPAGHPDLLQTLNSLGNLYLARRDVAHAIACLTESLQYGQRQLQASPNLETVQSVATNAKYVGRLCAMAGQYEMAERCYQVQTRLLTAFFSRDLYPHGHDTIALSYYDLGFALHMQGKIGPALESLREAQQMWQQLAEEHLGEVSEAEALNYLVYHLATPSLLLSTSRHAEDSDDSIYELLWSRRGIVHRIASRRRQALRNVKDEAVRAAVDRYQQTRRALSGLMLAPVEADPQRRQARRAQLRELTERKEQLERELAAAVPQFGRDLAEQRRPHTDLAQQLPQGTVYVDLLRYVYTPPPLGLGVAAAQPQPSVPSYVAFVVRPGKPVRRVELGAAAPIDEAVAAWRDEINRDATGKSPAALRKLLWQPIEAVLPGGTATVYLSPDGALSAIPWPALPGSQPGRILLEDYALALVPYGQFLLTRLAEDPQPAPAQAGRVLAVGDVDFGAPAAGAKAAWPALPATRQELDEVAALAGQRPVVTLAGGNAAAQRVLAELPRARFAHFATHGYFADKKFRSALQLDEESFGRAALTEHGQRDKAGSRNPLVLSGLVLAGANRAGVARGAPGQDPAILSGEALAALPLDQLRLAVLSACDTGLGDVGGGEGVIGLQRAFHGAGAENVIASLWKVDDQATAALMNVFYHKLWHEGQGPLQALREAQLTLYRHPERIKAISQARGLKLVESVPAADAPPRGPTAPTRLWAAFVLSGAGR